MAILKDWYVMYCGNSDTPPELQVPLVYGRVYGLDGGSDWRGVAFRPIGKNGNNIIAPGGNVYELGEARDDYEDMFPNARERALKSLPEVAVE